VQTARLSKHQKALQSLAQLYRVQTIHTDVSGKRRKASDESLIRVLMALGAPVREISDAAAALAERRKKFIDRVIEPVSVAWDGKVTGLRMFIPESFREKTIGISLELESGEVRSWSCNASECRPIHYENIGNSTFVARELSVPGVLPIGYHILNVEAGGAAFSAKIISAPVKAFAGQDSERIWGVLIPLYSLYSKRNPGAGDFTDLADLYRWTDGLGGKIVGTLPLLSAFLDTPYDPSPYSPASKLFWNEFYIDPEKAPEFEKSTTARALLDSARRDIEDLGAAPLVDYKRQMAAKRVVLEELTRTFFSRPVSERELFDRRRREDPSMEDYAGFRAFGERLQKPWREWPLPQRDGTIEPGDFDERVKDYHLYVQWEAGRQVENLSKVAKSLGPGLYLDLPIGINPNSYDTWRHRDLYLEEVSVGAPPDIIFPLGQNWGFPPLHPEKIREDGYRYVTGYLRKIMSRAGVLRIDHVPGLHRLFWVPQGMDAAAGVYVRYDADEFYAIFSIESHRNRCTVLGENLGTVPDYVNLAMGRHSVFRMYVLQYELESDDPKVLKPAPANSVAGLNTHDMPPLAGFLEGADVADRVSAVILDEAKAPKELGKRKRVRERLENFLAKKGYLAGDRSERAVMEAAEQYLAEGPAKLLLVNLEDLWLEKLPQNLPADTKYPNWRRKARFGIEEFREMPEAVNILREIDRLRKRPRKRT